jgi:hypothetical protein
MSGAHLMRIALLLFPPSLPSPPCGEGVRLRRFLHSAFVSSINQHFAIHRNIKPRIADKLLHLNTQDVHFHQAANVFLMEQTHDHHLHHPL